MGFSQILTEIATAATNALKVVLPGAAEAVVDFGDKLIYSGTGDAKQVTAVFGFALVGGIVGFAIWGVKKIVSKVF